jgi:hypothetical protein
MVNHKILKIKGTENSFILSSDDTNTIKVLINNANDIALVITDMMKRFEESRFQTEILGFKADADGVVKFTMEFTIGETFGEMTEDKFLEYLNIYSDVKYKNFVRAIRNASVQFDKMCEKYKLLIE